MMMLNEVYDGSENQTIDWGHQLDKLDQSYAGTCTPGRLTCSQFVQEFSNNAAGAGTVKYGLHGTSNKSFWQRRSSPTEDVELGGQRCQTVWHYHSLADWERATISATEERFAKLIVGYSVVVAEWRNMMIPFSLRVTSSIRQRR